MVVQCHLHQLNLLPLGRQALIRRAASALKYIVYNNYAVPNGIRTFFLLVDREKIKRILTGKCYTSGTFLNTHKKLQKEDHGGARVSSLLLTPPVLSR